MENIVQGQWFRGPSADLGDPIDQSLRLRLNASYLSSTLSATPSSSTMTVSFWYKSIGTRDVNLFRYLYSTGSHAFLNQGYLNSIYNGTGSAVSVRPSTSVDAYTDPSAWYHIVAQYSGGVYTLWVNGVQWSATTFAFNPSTTFRIGSWSLSNNSGNRGAYFADFHYLDGTAKDEEDFGRYNEDGVWVPIATSFTAAEYGAAGFHLTFDSSQSNAGVGEDSAPIGASGHTARNDFTATGVDTTASSTDYDLMQDSPTQNYATLNPLQKFPTSTQLQNANLANLDSNGNYPNVVPSTFLLQGKVYWECTYINGNGYPYFGITPADNIVNGGAWYQTNIFYYNSAAATSNIKNFGATETVNFGTSTTGDVIGFAFDADTNELTMSKNGTQAQTFTLNTTETRLSPHISSALSRSGAINFGQQPFIYTPPEGFEALQTNNLAEPEIKNGKEHFEVFTYTGNSTDNRDVTGLNFQPDLLFIKNTATTSGWTLVDSVRGPTKRLLTNASNAESTTTTYVKAFNSDGFRVGTAANVNGNSNTILTYAFKGGGAAVSNTNGTITSSVSANTDAGFSIVSYTGTGANATIGHGLTEIPELVIYKRRDSSNGWVVYSSELATTEYLQLHNDSAKVTGSSTMFNSLRPTNSLLNVGTNTSTNASGGSATYIAYCWHSVEGFSKFGSYDGNSSADGPFIYCGFKPSLVAWKRINSTGGWFSVDSARDPTNLCTNKLRWDTSDSESTASAENVIDILSNGFKIRAGNATQNNSSGEYIYMAWAESPFGGENAPPVTAR